MKIFCIHQVHPSVQDRTVSLVSKLITFYRLLGKRSNTNKSPVIPLKCGAGPSVLSMEVSAANLHSAWQEVVWLQGSEHTAWAVRGPDKKISLIPGLTGASGRQTFSRRSVFPVFPPSMDRILIS